MFNTNYILDKHSKFKCGITELPNSAIKKIDDTIKYSMSCDPLQDRKFVATKCAIAIMAEYKVSIFVEGQINNEPVNFEDSYTYAFDVLSSIKYNGTRIEVKTHQTQSKWITINIEKKNNSGSMNLYHFLEYNVSDIIVIYNTNKINNYTYSYNKVFLGDKNDLKKVLKKSNYEGWYLKNL